MVIAPELLAYFAGIVDADGSIGIRCIRASRAKRPDFYNVPVYSERVAVTQVQPEAIMLLHDSFGGALSQKKSHAKNGQPLWAWQIADLKASRALDLLQPHLRIKQRQADNCLELRRLKAESRLIRLGPRNGAIAAKTRPEHLTKAMHACYDEARRLNLVGRTPTSTGSGNLWMDANHRPT